MNLRACLAAFLAAILGLAAPISTPLGAPALRPSSAAIRAMDVDETARWYRENLDFRTISDQTRVQARSVVLDRGGFLLEITEDERILPRRPETDDVEVTGSAADPALAVLVSDVDSEIERLRSRGVEIVTEPHDELEGRFRTGLVRDNGGRMVELREPLPSGDAFHAEGR